MCGQVVALGKTVVAGVGLLEQILLKQADLFGQILIGQTCLLELE